MPMSHLLHPRDDLRLAIYQLVCLPIHFLFLPIHLYLFNDDIRVHCVLWPVRVLLYIELLFFYTLLLRNSLAKCLVVLFARSHGSL